MRTYAEIQAEIAEWEDELSDALDELCDLHLVEDGDSMLHEYDDAEVEWLEMKYADIYERIDCAEFWLEELEAELEDCRRADGTDELIEFVEIAEESALSELAAFGHVEPWFFGEPDLNEFDLWCDERHLSDIEWSAWNDATDDMDWRFFELDMSM